MIDYSKTKEIIRRRGYNYKSAAEACGISCSQLRSVVCYNHDPMTDIIAKMCFGLKCCPSDLMDFDFEYPKTNMLDIVSNGTGKLTYNPLRKFIIQNAYQKKSPASMPELFDLLRRYYVRTLEEEEKCCAAMNKARGIDVEESRKRGLKRVQPEGLSYRLRIAINNDRPVRMPTIYDICKELKCSPDCVLYYK